MTEEGLNIFNMVAECGSNSEAARILHIPQSRVSRTITRLENQFGTKLINRDTTPFTLTKNGCFLKYQLDRGMSLSQQLNRFIEEQNLQQIQIGYSFPVSWKIISRQVYRLKQFDPKIKICVSGKDQFQLRRLLSEGQLDFAISPDKLHYPDYHLIEIIDDYELGLVAPSGIPLTKRRFVERDDLIRYPLLIPDEKNSAQAIAEWIGNLIYLRNFDTYNNLETMIGLINNGFGVGFAPKEDRYLFDVPRLTYYVSHPKIVIPLYVYTRWKRDMSDELRMFLDFYEERIR